MHPKNPVKLGNQDFGKNGPKVDFFKRALDLSRIWAHSKLEQKVRVMTRLNPRMRPATSCATLSDANSSVRGVHGGYLNSWGSKKTRRAEFISEVRIAIKPLWPKNNPTFPPTFLKAARARYSLHFLGFFRLFPQLFPPTFSPLCPTCEPSLVTLSIASLCTALTSSGDCTGLFTHMPRGWADVLLRVEYSLPHAEKHPW